MIKKFDELWPYAMLVLIVGAVLAWGMFGGSRNGAERSAIVSYSSGVLSTTENSLDFGTISMARGKVEHEFVLKNNGNEAVTVTNIVTSCMCTNAYLIMSAGESYGPFGMSGHGAEREIAAIVRPGESVKLRAVFDPAAHGPAGVGIVQRSIYLETNSATAPRLELKFYATVTE